jgi:hypothetical protein
LKNQYNKKHKAEQSRAKQSKAEQSKAKQSKAEQKQSCTTKKGGAGQLEAKFCFM